MSVKSLVEKTLAEFAAAATASPQHLLIPRLPYLLQIQEAANRPCQSSKSLVASSAASVPSVPTSNGTYILANMLIKRL